MEKEIGKITHWYDKISVAVIKLTDEKNLFEFADSLNEKSIRFMISYIVEHKGRINMEFKNWIKLNNYRLINIDKINGNQRDEVLIMNYS